MFLVFGIIMISGWYCCNLWFTVPRITLETDSIKPLGVSMVKDPDTGFYSIDFSLQAILEVVNRNILGCTINTALVEVWLINPAVLQKKNKMTFIGNASLTSHVRI